MKKTYMAKKEELKRQWYLVDARGKILGRLAAKIAAILRGKHKPIFTPHVDTGDGIIVINASKIQVTGRKLKEKVYLSYSGYQGGQKKTTLETMLKKSPETVIRLAVKRMLPANALGRDSLRKLKVYADEQHGQAAQKPINLEF